MRGLVVVKQFFLCRGNVKFPSLLLAAFFNELFGSVSRFAVSNHPARDIAAENIQNDV